MQQPGEPLTLSFGSESERRTIRADTLWELLLGHREDCRVHLLPLLYKIRSDWQLLATADQVKGQLLTLARSPVPTEHESWSRLVAQLGDDNFSKREEADRRLRANGRRVLVFLRTLDPQTLDAEQRFRVARIVRGLSGIDVGDQSREIAEELRDNPSIWLALAGDEEESTRGTAKNELQRILQQSIEFDPAADQSIRNDQLNRIEKSIRP